MYVFSIRDIFFKFIFSLKITGDNRRLMYLISYKTLTPTCLIIQNEMILSRNQKFRWNLSRRLNPFLVTMCFKLKDTTLRNEFSTR